jgi:signal transduction histidine kinase
MLNHDLRSPINAILGFAELLTERDNPAETVNRYASIIAKGGENMTEMLDQAVLLMRTTMGSVVWQPEDAPLSHALHGLNVEGDPQGRVHWDMEMMRRALEALVHRTEMENSDRVLIMTSPSHVHITIGQPGEGERPLDGDLHHIPIQMARQIIEHHGGNIRTDDLGSWFQVLVPKQPTWTQEN